MWKNSTIGGLFMILLGIIILALGAYLVYALINPEKF
ncbi:potassium-transporting ATPase subunit F [Clostridium kluyveri]|uniref:Potassium-transporting ATPase subunit F n=1 Tax=Clostridium kluyveri TaxID=1534 RepID=A0A1L5F754_CLOKL|nr:potassium-transporting ATPase subunit F [Clostridium kluyveri]